MFVAAVFILMQAAVTGPQVNTAAPINWARLVLEQQLGDAGMERARERDAAWERKELADRWGAFAAAMNACGEKLEAGIADRKKCAAAVKAFDRLTRDEGWPKGGKK